LSYKVGRRFEYRVRDLLTKHGYFVVRAAASKGIADLVALKLSMLPLLVQSKMHGVLGKDEWDMLFDVSTAHGAVPIFARKDAKRRVELFRLTGHKIPRARTQPMEPFCL